MPRISLPIKDNPFSGKTIDKNDTTNIEVVGTYETIPRQIPDDIHYVKVRVEFIGPDGTRKTPANGTVIVQESAYESEGYRDVPGGNFQAADFITNVPIFKAFGGYIKVTLVDVTDVTAVSVVMSVSGSVSSHGL